METHPDAFAAALAHIDRVFAAPTTTCAPARQTVRRERTPTPKAPALDNKALMQAAVRNWIAAAQTHPRGAELLAEKADWLEVQMNDICNPDIPLPDHLEGLTAWDLTAAHSAVFKAARLVRA